VWIVFRLHDHILASQCRVLSTCADFADHAWSDQGVPQRTYSVRYMAKVGRPTQAHTSDWASICRNAGRPLREAASTQKVPRLDHLLGGRWVHEACPPAVVVSPANRCFAVPVWQDDKAVNGSVERSATTSYCVLPPLCPSAGSGTPKMAVSATNELLQCRAHGQPMYVRVDVWLGCSGREPWLKTHETTRPERNHTQLSMALPVWGESWPWQVCLLRASSWDMSVYTVSRIEERNPLSVCAFSATVRRQPERLARG
jgi:hypothetical protein